MEQQIIKHLNLVERSISWIEKTLEGEKQRSACYKLGTIRRKLKRKKSAMEGNPAAALFGESQAGKSYLVSALLSTKGNPFTIKDASGNEYDFKADINPRGNEIESTSMVTRFSTKPEIAFREFPIIARLLSPTDIILVICEAYFNNLKVNQTLSYEELKEKISEVEKFYSDKPAVQKFITEDDIWEIAEYFNINFSKLVYNNIKDAKYFERISSFIQKIPPADWNNVFSVFWNFNDQLTLLFNDLIEHFTKLGFPERVFLPIESVLRKKGTLLDVERLDEMYSQPKGQEPEYTSFTKILIKKNDGKEEIIEFSKPFLCALTAELIFNLPEGLETTKLFLKTTDLLDFPGTRRPENANEQNFSKTTLPVLFRRGKVDYLFNIYSMNERINALLFCQKHTQSNQSVMPEKLNRWISNMIGESPSKRELFYSPISPLFVISTWFNKDMEYNHSTDKPDSTHSFNERWKQRFHKTLESEIIKVNEYPWLTEWKITEPYFKNIFLLRDFEKSGMNALNCSNLFKGYDIHHVETEENVPVAFPDFRNALRQSFIDFPFVQRHFEDPQISWDKAATINEDGTGLIIEKLGILSNFINPARIEKIRKELSEILTEMVSEMRKYHHSNDKDEEIIKSKAKAGEIQFRLDTAFRANGINQFGQFMKDLMIAESNVVEVMRKRIEDIEHRDLVYLDKYSTYKEKVPVRQDDTIELYFERLCNHYEKNTEEEKIAFRTQLEVEGILLEELIDGNAVMIKNSAKQLAEALLDYWLTYVNLNDKQCIQKVLGGEGTSYLGDVSEMYQKLFAKLKLADIIEEKIRRFTDGQGKSDIPYEIIADMSAELLNKFINSVGFYYFDISAIHDLEVANAKNNLGLVLDTEIIQMDNSIEDLFTKIEQWPDIIQRNPEVLKSLPTYRNYKSWYNRLKIGFVSVCDIPNYDVAANEKLGNLILECETLYY